MAVGKRSSKRPLQKTLAGGRNIDLAAEFDELKTSLLAALEAAIDTGVTTGGSNTTIVDTGKSWAVNMWADATFEVVIAGRRYLGIVTSNTADTITFPALAGGAAVAAGCEYSLKRPVTLADISDRAARLLGVIQSLTQWGGTNLTGRDISLDLKALVDDSIKGILKSIGDAGAAENLLERIGEVQASPTANTVLDRLKAILGASTKDLTTLETELAKKVNKATTPTKYALAITNADTQYSQALPANTKQFSVHLRDYSAFRLAYVTGKVATPTDPYETVPAGSEKYVENIGPSSLTLYIAAPAGTKVAEIEAWA